MSNYDHEHRNTSQHSNNRGGNRGSYGHGEPTKSIPLSIPAHNNDSYPFFLLGRGISRQVIQTDLSRYLGNNAQCKPGHDEYGRPGFWYKGYRQLTDAQIHTLKEVSAKWRDERQQYASQGEHDGPDYVDSRTFEHGYKNNAGRLNPSAVYRRDPEPTARHPITVAERPDQEPQYRYMPSPDNRPWYDNWSRQYVHPFREPGTKSPEPPAQDQIPRHIVGLSEPTVAPPEEEDGFAIPVDKNTGQPIPGEWTRDRDGSWLFRIAGGPNRSMQSLRGRNDPEE